jgi:3-hydroxybutyrate dehydrogenase
MVDIALGEKILLREAAIKRFLELSEIVELFAFLCSDAAKGITGSEHKIDCGWTAQ